MVLTSFSQDKPVYEQYYKASDFTSENLFTENIEGPNVDRNGNLFAVNYQKNGTIGLVRPNGKAELFITLPEGSTGNAIMFDMKGDLLVADFTGQRAGVYFEAGFALGLGLPVIWTCNEEDKDALHFDTRQFNHILWTCEADLFQKLKRRIEATISL